MESDDEVIAEKAFCSIAKGGFKNIIQKYYVQGGERPKKVSCFL